MLCNIVLEIRNSCFVPSAFEEKIGGKEKNSLPAVVLGLENGSSVSLCGTVDRVDFCKTEDGTVYFRVIDYKSGDHTFNLEDVKTGMDIQLVLYLFAVAKANPESVPAGANFIALKNPISDSPQINRTGFFLNDPALLQAADPTTSFINIPKKGNQKEKIFKQSLEEMNDLIEQMKEIVCEIGKKILSGFAEKTPSQEACKYCAIRGHCDQAVRPKEY